jgi:arginine exporter protein ArgO
MVASVGIGAPGYFVAGVFTGSMTWWLVLSSTAAWIGGVVELRGTALDRLAAATLAGFGTYAIWKGFVR